jgi:hypothetical protein
MTRSNMTTKDGRRIWHPRGEPTWPNAKQAKPGQRVEHVRSGHRGTFVRFPRTQAGRSPGYAVIEWDGPKYKNAFGHRAQGRVVAYAFDLRPIEDR